MSAQRRLDAVVGHLNTGATTTQSPGLRKILEKSPDDIVTHPSFLWNIVHSG